MKALRGLAEQAQAQESKATLAIPSELACRAKRVAALKPARAVIEARARELAAARPPEYEARPAARPAQRDAGQKPRGQEPRPPGEPPDPKAQANFTDPENGIMKAGNGPHFEQACKAQAAVD